MNFQSILFAGAEEPLNPAEPACFRDLFLDQIVAAATAGRQDYALDGYFYAPLSDPDLIVYRQEILRDLEDGETRRPVLAFSKSLRAVQDLLAQIQKSSYPLEQQRWFLRSVELYCQAIRTLVLALDRTAPRACSRGLVAFREHLLRYTRSDGFTHLDDEARGLVTRLAALRYCLLIEHGKVTVRPRQDEEDFSESVEAAFEKFRRDAAPKDYRVRFNDGVPMNHIEAQILDRVALLNPGVFADLARFRVEHEGYPDPCTVRFEREVQFYLAWLEYLAPLKAAGLDFCLPRVSENRAVLAKDAFDLALARKLVHEKTLPVRNDFRLSGKERILLVTGPNQGGKTTFSRMFGQMHHLARLGCSVPGSRAELLLSDGIFTHYEREEHIADLRSKLEDDLVRIKDIFSGATRDSILIFNEVFASTSVKDALFLGDRLLARVSALDALCVCVTFLDELASFNEKTVSMVGAVDPERHATRTFKVERRPADGLAYALAIAEKHRVTYDWLMKRLSADPPAPGAGALKKARP